MANYKEKMNRGYNIAGHNMRNSEGSKEEAKKIFEKGLTISSGKRSIRYTTVQIGDKYRNKNIKNDINKLLSEYLFSPTSEGYNILVMSPTIIRNSKGEELFLGDPFLGEKDSDFASSGKEYEPLSILDLACSKMQKIPPEFIYGYVNIYEGSIVRNPNHYSQNPEVNDKLFDEIVRNLDPMELELSKAIASGNKKAIDQFKDLFKTYGLMDSYGKIIDKAEKEFFNQEKEIEEI